MVPTFEHKSEPKVLKLTIVFLFGEGRTNTVALSSIVESDVAGWGGREGRAVRPRTAARACRAIAIEVVTTYYLLPQPFIKLFYMRKFKAALVA